MKELKTYSYYRMTRGMCRTCRKIVDSRIVEREGSIVQENLCSDCGTSSTIIAESSEWYFNQVSFRSSLKKPVKINTGISRGCPRDCGLCSWHESGPTLPVFSITNACNLKCPICFTYNREDSIYFMSVDEMKKTVDFLLENNEHYDLINITGGEPTLHPDLLELLQVASVENIGRITVNSNGLTLARDRELVRKLAQAGVYIILSFDTLDPETSVRIHGRDIVQEKLKALDQLAEFDIGVTLLNVMIKGVNDHEIFDIIRLARKYDNIRSVTIQNMTFTGQGGSVFEPRERLTIDGAVKAIEKSSEGLIKKENFFPLPSSHPLCYNIGYFFKDRDQLHSFNDFISTPELIKLLGESYIMHPDERFQEVFNEAIMDNWARSDHPEILSFIRNLLKKMYPSDRAISPFERQKIAEKSILTIYVHAHMDEDNFDLDRIVCCGDLVPVDGERLIPACAYNLFYRMKDSRFWHQEQTKDD